MALIICTECGKEFSDRAAACPNCACPTVVILQELKAAQGKVSGGAKNRLPIFAGTFFEFGRWPYEEDGDIKPIRWKVFALLQRQNLAILVSENIIDAKPFNSSFEDITWHTSTVGKWLNTTFLNQAFTRDEQSVMINPFENDDSFWRVFLPTSADLQNMFPEIEQRLCNVTPYARRNGVWTDAMTGCGPWWLQNVIGGRYATAVKPDGQCEVGTGIAVDYGDIGVRPIIVLSYTPVGQGDGEFGYSGVVVKRP